MTTAQRTATARRRLNNMASFIRRPGLTGWVKDRDARSQYHHALRAVLAIEDADGIDAAAPFSDRLTALRQEAQAARLLTAEDICEIEREVIA